MFPYHRHDDRDKHQAKRLRKERQADERADKKKRDLERAERQEQERRDWVQFLRDTLAYLFWYIQRGVTWMLLDVRGVTKASQVSAHQLNTVDQKAKSVHSYAWNLLQCHDEIPSTPDCRMNAERLKTWHAWREDQWHCPPQQCADIGANFVRTSACTGWLMASSNQTQEDRTNENSC